MIGLPLDGHDINSRKRKWIIGGVALLVSALIIFFSTNLFNYFKIAITSIPDQSKICPLQPKIAPKSFYKDNSTVLMILNDEKYKKESVERLSGAIQVDTQIFDHPPDVGKDPKYWEKFVKFHKYLEKTFPLVYSNLDIEKVNTYGLIFTWKGSNKKLKPVMLAAHQDTVPVQKSTLEKWTYPPFEGKFDGEYIYGRGSVDCKNVLIGILETLELLLSEDYKPDRTIIAAFGFDEESSGVHGAQEISKVLESQWGLEGLELIIDEGSGVSDEQLTDTIVAAPGVAEKGYIDVQVELTTPGGHSSIPPDHTSIGIISELGYLIEQNQFDPILTSKSPIFDYFQCLAVHDPKDKIPNYFKKIILRSGYDKFANSKLVESIVSNRFDRYLIQTSQALDIINGGEKANALPEDTKLLINSRIDITSSVSFVKNHYTEKVVEVAKRHNLKVYGFDDKVVYEPESSENSGEFYIKALSELEPAPITPINTKVFKAIAGVNRHVFEDLVFKGEKGYVLTASAFMTGNTDCRYYYGLTKNVYRYSPMFVSSFIAGLGIHSVDERLPFNAHLQLTAWFYEFLQVINNEKL
ncbi:CPS1 [Candida jiufengensis]|uniref:CPS1 n=1 Tax=Candida jiufengensis TaxID=497108 RepID=UPI00222433C7|nr:CPS1 [Candida jiufengensis]KAI5955184.1 CPS1 [Candida jiufengensis]